MKKFLIAASTLFVGTASAKIDFYATAPKFYGKDTGSELSKSKPIEIYNKLISEEKISPDEAAKAYKELRTIRSIRTAIGEKYPGAGLLERRTGGFGGFFGFGQPEDYTESALTIIESKLAAAGNVDTSKDPFTDIRAEVVKTITPHFTAEENTKLNQLVELEALWGSDAENAKNSSALLALAQKIGIEAAIKKLLPELTVEEPKKEEKPAPSEPEKKEESKPAVEEPEKIPQKPLVSYLDDITGLLLGEKETTSLEKERKDLYDLVAKIVAAKPKDADLKNVNETTLKIINAVDTSAAGPFDWSTEIESAKEERPKQVLDEKDVPWIIIPKVGQKGPIDLLSRQDFDEKTQKAIAGFFKSVKDTISNSNSRIWADYGAINLSPTAIDSTAKESTDKRIKELAQLTKNERADRAYPIYEEALTEHLLNLIAGEAPSALSSAPKYYAQWIERTRNVIDPKSSKMADDLIDRLALIIFAEKFFNKNLNAEEIKKEWLATIDPLIHFESDEIDALNDSLKDGLEFLEHTRKSQHFTKFKDSVVKSSLNYIKGSPVENDIRQLLISLQLPLPGEAKATPGGIKLPGAEEIKAKKIAAETSPKEIILSLEKLSNALQALTLATANPK